MDPKQVAEKLARSQGGVISRRQLLRLGVTRWQTRQQLRARRWNAHHRQTIAVHTGPLQAHALHWSAIFESGDRGVLDGVSALVAAGLKGFDTKAIRVSLPRGARVFRLPGVDMRQTRRLKPADVAKGGIPRVRPAIAAVRAALWARTDREAALLITMTVQQRIATAEEIGEALLQVRRARRRRFIERVVLDAMGGSQSLGELDLVRGCRRRGLPAPERQQVRRTRNGTYYLDARWPAYGVVLEVDGIHHLGAAQVVADAIRHNEIAVTDEIVLRLPLLGLRLQPDAFFEQLERALRSRGWRRAA